MQAAYLILSKNLTEKQVGALFLAFGLSQFLCMSPAGYFLDYSHRKIAIVNYVSMAVAALTIIGTVTAQEEGKNMGWLMFCRILQGGLTAILPPGFNGITLGIVGTKGFTLQVSRNRIMTHMGTAVVVAFSGWIAYLNYPNIGALFFVSPLATIGAWHYLSQVVPNHVDRDAARGLILESPTMTEYELADDVAICKQQAMMLLRVEKSTIDFPSPVSGDSMDDLSSDFVILESSAGNLDSRIRSPPRATPRRAVSPISLATDGASQTSSVTGGANSSYPMGSDGLVQSGLDPPSSGNMDRMMNRPPRPPSSSARQHNMDDKSSQASSSSSRKSYSSMPSFHVGWGDSSLSVSSSSSTQNADGAHIAEHTNKHMNGFTPPPRARTPLAVLMNKSLVLFTAIVFFFNLANSSVLPLVMQSLSVQDSRFSILLSSLCIFIAQSCMAFFAKFCGDYSPYWGRKKLMLVGLVSLSIRCFLLTFLVSVQNTLDGASGDRENDNDVRWWLKSLILSTQFLDSVGAGITGTLQVLVIADISGGTGRFSLMLGVTSAAMCLGATISGYLGPFLAYEYGYPFAFSSLGMISLIPFLLYVVCMLETMPPQSMMVDDAKRRRVRLSEVLTRLKESTHRRWRRSRERLSNLLIAISTRRDDPSKKPVNPVFEVQQESAEIL